MHWAPPKPAEIDIFGPVFDDIFGVRAMAKKKAAKKPANKPVEKRKVTPRQKPPRGEEE